MNALHAEKERYPTVTDGSGHDPLMSLPDAGPPRSSLEHRQRTWRLFRTAAASSGR